MHLVTLHEITLEEEYWLPHMKEENICWEMSNALFDLSLVWLLFSPLISDGNTACIVRSYVDKSRGLLSCLARSR